MIFRKFVTVIRAFFNSIANALWERDPIAIMRLEYDRSVEQLQEGRKGLELYRGLVERVVRQTTMGKSQVEKMKAEVKAYLKAGDRETAGKFALQLQKAEADLAQNQEQLKMHEEAYENNLKKIQYANKQLAEDVLQQYEVELGLKSPETTPVVESNKNLGPATDKNT